MKRSTLMMTIAFAVILVLSWQGASMAASDFGDRYPLEVKASTAKKMVDDKTGAELLFLTSGPTQHQNLYFHQRSWLSDDSVILYNSKEELGGLSGYITATGETFRITTADGAQTGSPTAAVNHPAVYCMSGDRILEIKFEIEPSGNPAETPSKVYARERLITEFKGSKENLNESCDGRFLAVGSTDSENPKSTAVYTISTQDGAMDRICGMPAGTTLTVSHVQWSTTNPNWISFCNAPIRIWVVDIRDKKPWAPYAQRPGELVTHESWWVNDTIVFCGGVHSKPKEDAHVKVMNPRTGEVRIIGEGAWLENASEEDIDQNNWWHCSGSPTGNWVAGDNWFGNIMLFEGLTARPQPLTFGHRTYGGGAHPEVGWDRHGNQVVFASNKQGDGGVHVCVCTIPAEWQEANRQLGRRIESIEPAK